MNITYNSTVTIVDNAGVSHTLIATHPAAIAARRLNKANTDLARAQKQLAKAQADVATQTAQVVANLPKA